MKDTRVNHGGDHLFRLAACHVAMAVIMATLVCVDAKAACVLATESSSDTLALVDTGTMSVTGRIETPGNPIAIAVAADGATAYAGLESGEVLSLSLSNRSFAVLFKSGDDLTDIALTPDGESIVTVSNRALALFDLATGRTWRTDVSCDGECIPSSVAISANSRYAFVPNLTYVTGYHRPPFIRIDLRELALFEPGSPCQCCEIACCDTDLRLQGPRHAVVVSQDQLFVTIDNALGLSFDSTTGDAQSSINASFSEGGVCTPSPARVSSSTALAADGAGNIFVTGIRDQVIYNAPPGIAGVEGLFVFDASQRFEKVDEFDLSFVGVSIAVASNQIIVGTPGGSLAVVDRVSRAVRSVALEGISVAVAVLDGQACRIGAATPTPKSSTSCTGDCSDDGRVSVEELVKGVNIALGILSLDVCFAFDPNGDGRVTVHEIVGGTANALRGC